MAMMLALNVVEPQSSGIGGGGFLVHHDGQSGLIDTIDGRETAPSGAKPGRFLGPDGKPMAFRQAMPGGLSVGVQGNVDRTSVVSGQSVSVRVDLGGRSTSKKKKNE